MGEARRAREKLLQGASGAHKELNERAKDERDEEARAGGRRTSEIGLVTSR